jgi:hypothetical protein
VDNQILDILRQLEFPEKEITQMMKLPPVAKKQMIDSLKIQ